MSVSLCSNLLSTDTCCLAIILGIQRDMVSFMQGSVVQSSGVSSYTCLNQSAFGEVTGSIVSSFLTHCCST